MSIEQSRAPQIGTLVAISLPALPGKRIGQIVQIAGEGLTIAIGSRETVQCDQSQVLGIEKLFRVIPREIPNHRWQGLGRRSVRMYRRVDAWPQFEGGGFVFKGSGYALLSRNIRELSQTCIASFGGNRGREIFTFDPRRDLLIGAVYDQLRERVGALALTTEEEILRELCRWMREEVFTHRDIKNVTQAQHVGDFVYGYRPKGPLFDATLVVSIDRFIEKKVGSCRHHAFVTHYLIERLCRDQILRGTTIQMRDSLPSRRAHAWVVFKSDAGAAWHVDTTWNRVADFSIQKNCETLIRRYS